MTAFTDPFDDAVSDDPNFEQCDRIGLDAYYVEQRPERMNPSTLDRRLRDTSSRGLASCHLAEPAV